MIVALQIVLSSGLLIIAMLLQIAAIAWIVRRLRHVKAFIDGVSVRKTALVSAVIFIPLLMTHTIHVYAWAFAVWVLGALPGYEQPIYFALVTYTTVGYGDVTLGEEFRIFGAMASVNGILAFGLTTAFLVGVFSKILESLREEP